MTAKYLQSTARFSRCQRYRYELTRRWAEDGQVCAFIGLNPSTADAEQDDPTVRRCIGFAKRDGFAGLVMLNLFAVRGTNPDILSKVADPVGAENDRTLWAYLRRWRHCRPVACWGAHDSVGPRVERFFKRSAGRPPAWLTLLCFGRTKDGHPLYLPGAAELTPWLPAQAED